MSIQPVVKGLYSIPLGFVNVFLIEQDGLTLIDTGISSSLKPILGAIQELGKRPSDLHSILITHLHGDHTGSLAALKKATGAQVFMHPAEASLIRQGISSRPANPAPGFVRKLIASLISNRASSVDAVETDHPVQDGEVLPIAGGIQVIYTPGHTAGHVVYLWQPSKVLFAGDSFSNQRKFGYGFIYEDFATGQASIRSIAGLDFDVLCFGHGSSIAGNAREVLRHSDFVNHLS